MATKQRKLKASVKKTVMEEAGNKCANPGCANWRAHVHHIKHWAIYQSDDESILIPVCPTCHDYIHHGSLDISDEILYQWKSIVRKDNPKIAHIFCEPAPNPRVYFGTSYIRNRHADSVVINASDSNYLKFRIIDDQINLLNIKLSDLKGNEVVRVTENHVRVLSDELVFNSYPGRVRITTRHINKFITDDLLRVVRAAEPQYAIDEFILLDIEVINSGKVKVQGCWVKNHQAFVATETAYHLAAEGLDRPATMRGKDDSCGITFTGDPEQSIIMFER